MPNILTLPRPRSAYIWIWFAFDAMLALLPPVYWVGGQPKPIVFGLPCSIVYFSALCIFITASLVAAYRDDEARGAFKESVAVNETHVHPK